MAKYTLELRQIAELKNNEIQTVFEDFLTDYPLFDETYRNTLNTKILKHYYFNEIGFETPERFVFELNRKMSEIMTYYNKLYLSEIEINPLINYKKVVTTQDILNSKDTETSNDISNETVNIDDLQSETITNTHTENETLNTTGSRVDRVETGSENNKTNERTTVSVQNATNTTDTGGSTKNKTVSSDTPTSQLISADIEGDIYATNLSVSEDNLENQSTTNQLTNETTGDNITQSDISTQEQDTTSNLSSDTIKDITKNLTSSKNNTNESELIKNNSKQAEKEHENDTQRNVLVNDVGATISESELLLKYRETFLNIDSMIINDLKSLFMMVL